MRLGAKIAEMVPNKDKIIVGIVLARDKIPIAVAFINIFVINKSSPEDRIELNFEIVFHIPDFNNSKMTRMNWLKELGFDTLWLDEMLRKQGIIKIDNIYLATYDGNGNLSVYLTNNN